jgi:ATP-binding cassette subfamily G (WHITE) protein 2 (PDR)
MYRRSFHDTADTNLKHNRYALYHPSAEALSSLIVDLPYKITNSLVVNSTLYFMTNLRREPGPFFFFLLIACTYSPCID